MSRETNKQRTNRQEKRQEEEGELYIILNTPPRLPTPPVRSLILLVRNPTSAVLIAVTSLSAGSTDHPASVSARRRRRQPISLPSLPPRASSGRGQGRF